MTTVHIPALLRPLVDGAETVDVDVAEEEELTVRQLVARLEEHHPGLLDELTVDGDLLPGIAVFIDSEQAFLGLRSKVKRQSVVHFLPPIQGG